MKVVKFGNDLTWIALEVSEMQENPAIAVQYDLDSEIVNYAQDKNERPHMEFDRENEVFILIYNALDPEKTEKHYRTIPMTFVIQEGRILTIYHAENQPLIDRIEHHLLRHRQITSFQLLFIGLYVLAKGYIAPVEEMDRAKDEINRQLRERTTKSSLLALSDIETGMLYLYYAANQNALLLSQLKKKSIYKTLNEEEIEQLEDAVIEADQLTAMLQLNNQVLDQLANTYNNILNNNLNENMRILTIVSVLLAILAVVTGFFGMNVPLPLTHTRNAWLLILVGCFMLWVIYALIFDYLTRKNRK